MPLLQKIRDGYADKGLQVVSVHRPMNESDLDHGKIAVLINKLGINEHIIFDDDHAIGDGLGVEAWPTYFLFDAEGKLRRKAAGQLGIRMIEQSLIRMLGEPDEKVEVQSDEETVRVHAG